MERENMVEPTQYMPTTKYIIKAKFEVDGVVEKPDVIGAIFGQTEGLFGPDLDLRELQKSGRIGRIEIEIDSKRDKTTGTIVIPSSLDKASTAIIAAAIESVDRIGPCNARVTLEKVGDLREEKRKAIMNKAKEILQKWIIEASPSTEEILKEVSEAVRTAEIVSYGPEELPAGPEVAESSSIIIVEGRADVLNLLKCGIKNAIAIEGTSIPETIIELCKNKEVTAFLDGDRAGDLILRELMQVADIDYVARAPSGKEVEELAPKEILKSLRDKIPIEELRAEKVFKPKLALPNKVIEAAHQLKGTLEAVIFDEAANEVARIPVSELAEKLSQMEGANIVLFDGVITQRLLDIAEEKKIKYVIGDRMSEIAKRPLSVKLATISNILGTDQSI
jgi:DNA primase